jgi:phenylacetate-CoA ligase
MGANIYPEDVEQGLLADPAVAEHLRSFCVEMRELGDGAVRPCIHVEVTRRGGDDAVLAEKLRRQVVARLETSSRDFRAAVAENPTTAEIIIELHDPDTGPFAGNVSRIKRRYIVPSA